MDIQLFRTFLLVAKIENVTQAAEQLNFTQPAVTAQIRALEEHYGVELFERIGKKLHITEAGHQLTIHIEKLLTAYDDLNTAMKRFSNIDQPIKIGASTTAASYILSPILLDFQHRVQTGNVVVDICPTLPITIKGLMDNTFDIAIVHSKINHNQIVQFDLLPETLVWVVHRDLFAANQNSQDVSQYPFINFRPGCVYRTKFEKMIKDTEFNSTIEYSDAEAIKRAVLDGMGSGILPYVLVESFLEDGTLIEFTHVPSVDFMMSVAFHKNKALTPAMRAFLLVAAEHAKIQNGLKEYLDTKA
jgi:DNA-binding transcriptional LysR family regulator